MFLKKAKNANKFKLLEDVTEFKVDDFRDYELFKIQPITESNYGDMVKQKKIEELKKELASLGVSLNAEQPAQEVPVATEKQVLVEKKEKEFSGHPALKEDTPIKKGHNENGVLVKTEDDKNLEKTNIKKVVNGVPSNDNYTMGELKDQFSLFKAQVEKDIPEIIFSSVDKNGFVLQMTEVRGDLPRVLPNGIPIRQMT